MSSYITITDVARDMGVRLKENRAQKIGKIAKRAYIARYGKDPLKQKKWVQGAEMLVCSYVENDREILEEAVQEYKREQSKVINHGPSNISISAYFGH